MLNINSWGVGIGNLPCQNRAKESSLFSLWVNLWLSKGSCWRDCFILGVKCRKWDIISNVFWRGAATINQCVQFLKEGAPYTKPLFRDEALQEDAKQVRISSREATAMCLSTSTIPKKRQWAFHTNTTLTSPGVTTSGLRLSSHLHENDRSQGLRHRHTWNTSAVLFLSIALAIGSCWKPGKGEIWRVLHAAWSLQVRIDTGV